MINPELKKGDRIILYYMDDKKAVDLGTKGTVLKKLTLFGETQYEVEWDNGSKLSLIDGIDKWDLLSNHEERRNKRKLKEDNDPIERHEQLADNIEIFRFFNHKFLREYLLAVRDSGITNMFAAAPYLYMGSDRIKHEFTYKPIHDEESFDKVIEMADQSQAEMVNGVFKFLESKGIEPDLDNINRYLNRLSSKVLKTYMLLF
jgi:hypothetical protein